MQNNVLKLFDAKKIISQNLAGEIIYLSTWLCSKLWLFILQGVSKMLLIKDIQQFN